MQQPSRTLCVCQGGGRECRGLRPSAHPHPSLALSHTGEAGLE